MSILSSTEKDQIMDILRVIFRGQHSQFESVKHNFKSDTLNLVEEALTELMECNQSMKELTTSLVGGASRITKGWLKRVLRTYSRRLKEKSIQFDGLGCQVTAARNYRTAIYLSAAM